MTYANKIYIGEPGYLQLLKDVCARGDRRSNRTGIDTVALFGAQLRFYLDEGFPLFTTKKVWWKGVAVELDWMLRGESSIAHLLQHDVHIWDAWAKASYRPELGLPDGDIGPGYGVQWRQWAKCYRNGDDYITDSIDQIEQIVDKLRHHRDDRRIILSAWNVGDIDKMKLPPCHYAAQFLVDSHNNLTCIVSLRSWDLFLGGPFNVAQYSLLTHLLAHVSGLHAHEVIFNGADAHVYVNHFEQVSAQVSRKPRPLPKIMIDPSLEEIDDFNFEMATIQSYDPHPAIKGDVAV